MNKLNNKHSLNIIGMEGTIHAQVSPMPQPDFLVKMNNTKRTL
jgi:hypothetical protein